MDGSARPTVAGIGEFSLIDRLVARAPPGQGVVVGVGDDTAALRPTPGALLLATVDGQVEGTHFLRQSTPPRSLGHKALAVNLSDVAAMGGRPRWALVALALPADVELDWIDAVYAGMAALSERHGVGIVGGNVARTEGPIVVDVTLLGEVQPDRVLTRSGARPGDAVVVTGRPGESAAGLRLILESELGRDLPEAVAQALLRRHREPEPRVEAGDALARSGLATAAIDVSDGVAADLGHVLAASGVGATLEAAALPISPSLARLAAAASRDPLEFVLHGGEDYELLFTCPESRAADAIRTVGGDATRIGRIDAQPGLRLRGPDGTIAPVEARGHDHFSAGAT